MMPALGAMARLAGDIRVTAELLLIDDLGVTTFADFVSRKDRRAVSNFRDGCALVMSILAKAFGDDGSAKENKNRQEDDDDDGETDEMFGVLEQGCFPGPEAGKRSGTKPACDLG